MKLFLPILLTFTSLILLFSLKRAKGIEEALFTWRDSPSTTLNVIWLVKEKDPTLFLWGKSDDQFPNSAEVKRHFFSMVLSWRFVRSSLLGWVQILVTGYFWARRNFVLEPYRQKDQNALVSWPVGIWCINQNSTRMGLKRWSLGAPVCTIGRRFGLCEWQVLGAVARLDWGIPRSCGDKGRIFHSFCSGDWKSLGEWRVWKNY